MTEEAPIVLITGASTGIGFSLLQLLLKKNYRIVATARENSLYRFYDEGLQNNNSLLIEPLDVRNFDQSSRLINKIQNNWGNIDILINNAAISFRSVIEHMTDEDELEQLRVNFLGPMHLIRCVLPQMREQKYGRILNISSVGGMMAMPTMASYSASKFALEGATESLWYEVKPWNIKVSLIQPGFVHSNAFKKVLVTYEGTKATQNIHNPYHSYYTSMGRFVERLMNRSVSTPEKIAKIIYMTMTKENPPLRIPATLDAIFFSFLRRILPRNLYHWLLFKNLPEIKKWGHDEDK